MRGSMTRACLRTITSLLHVTYTRLTAPHRPCHRLVFILVAHYD
jgi:hypothetical protein